ncbi:hypothetical protein ADEAN_001048800 [Angomonas deanei]|uniref:Uncharacterized protein n=1 Tax=Angomonas deanei TaxID=59799 RepID=A0A7G2CXB5_9TRYP|nr:hypothetical protein ADEAN_001048800 [Angomonas deanei]
MTFAPQKEKKHPNLIEVELPRDKITSEEWAEDVYLLNQLDGVNDTPEEEGLPLRKWLLLQVHESLKKDPKQTSVLVKPKSKHSKMEFEFKIQGEYIHKVL